MNRKLTFFLCLAATALSTAMADQSRTIVPGPSTIDAVTVYQYRCLVTRSLAGDFAPGLYTWKFTDLPSQLLEESVRVSGRGTAAAKIIDIRIDRVMGSESGRETVRALERMLQDIDRQIQEVADRIEVLNKKGDLIKGLSLARPADDRAGSSGSGENPDGWQRRLDFIDSQLTLVLERLRAVNTEKKDLEKKRAVIAHDLDQQNGLWGKEQKAVFVDVDVTRAGTEKIDLTYVVPGVTWTPMYDVRIDSGKNEALVTYQALVTQRTGEDWTNVQLSLSTAQPASQGGPLQLSPWLANTADSQLGALHCVVSDDQENNLPGVTVTLSRESVRLSKTCDSRGRVSFFNLQPGLYDLRAELPGFKTVVQRGIEVRSGRIARLHIEITPAALEEQLTIKAEVSYEEAKDAAAPAEEPEIEAKTETSEAVDKMLSASFNIRDRQTVPSSTEKKKMTIAIVSLSLEKDYLAVPKLAEKISLVARITNGPDFPLLAGQASVFFDNDFISTAVIPDVSANDRFALTVGDVPGMKARWQLAGGTRAETGLIGKKVQLTYEITITLESLLKTAQTILVRDQVPITSSKDVTIEILETAPSPIKEADKLGTLKDGIISWSIPLAPMEKKEIKLKFRITHPKNSPLIEWATR